MNIYHAHLDNEKTIMTEAESLADAKKNLASFIKDNQETGKVAKIVKAEAPKPDNSYVEDDEGYTFTGWGIHVAKTTQAEVKVRKLMKTSTRVETVVIADSLEKAKEIVKLGHNIDVDKDPAPPKEWLERLAKA